LFYSFRVVVLSNQAGISLKTDPKTPKAQRSRLGEFKTKASAVFSQLDIPISIYAATEKDIYRKPRTGMWKELLEDYDIHQPADLNLQDSIFVGDAGGRHASVGHPKDFSCSDRYVHHRVLFCAVGSRLLAISPRTSESSSIPQKNTSSMKHQDLSLVHSNQAITYPKAPQVSVNHTINMS
jgi:DNA 3'-phosphatase